MTARYIERTRMEHIPLINTTRQSAPIVQPHIIVQATCTYLTMYTPHVMHSDLSSAHDCLCCCSTSLTPLRLAQPHAPPTAAAGYTKDLQGTSRRCTLGQGRLQHMENEHNPHHISPHTSTETDTHLSVAQLHTYMREYHILITHIPDSYHEPLYTPTGCPHMHTQ